MDSAEKVGQQASSINKGKSITNITYRPTLVPIIINNTYSI